MSSGSMSSYLKEVGVIRKLDSVRTERLPDVPWLMPDEFIRRQISII
jgi:hypothetical protein